MRPPTFVLVLALAAGASSADPRPALVPEPSKQFEHDVMARFHMHENYELYGAIERLLVRGRLDETRDLARGMGLAPDEPALTAWSKESALVRDRATALAAASSVDEACRRAAKLADACAGCHAETSAMPELRSAPPLPPDRPTVDARMTRHVWAVERLREGVIGGLDETWEAGLDVLAQPPATWTALDADRAGLAKQLRGLAEQARKRGGTDERAERARLYGEILVTCAACHTAAH